MFPPAAKDELHACSYQKRICKTLKKSIIMSDKTMYLELILSGLGKCENY